VIIKGGSCAGAGRVAAHLLRADQNERVKLIEIRGVAAEDLRGALIDMAALASGTNCHKPLYSASINPRAGEQLSAGQWDHAVERLEAALGLKGRPRVVVEHVKDGRAHRHVAWARVDPARKHTASDSHNYRIHETVARALEREFGFERVQGAHVERDGPRPGRTPSHDEMQQGARSGIDPRQAKAQITALWRSTKTGREFAAALKAAGWTLCRGDRRDFVLVDHKGGVHSLARRVEGATAKSIRARMADIDPMSLPSVKEARAMLRPDGTGQGSAAVLAFPRPYAAAADRAGQDRERDRPQRLAA
jgi:hypothetical protein